MLRKFSASDSFMLWLIALPGVLFFLVFKYVPMLGNVIAFQDYNLFTGIAYSPWVGFKHFANMFTYEEFYHILTNTLLLSLYSLLFGFPAPLILALFLNEIRRAWFKRPVQTLLYLPHFLSWVIVGSIFINLLSYDGFLNTLLGKIGVRTVDYLTQPSYFRSILVGMSIWKEMGWGMIIYLAALSGINPNLYEAARVDGAGRFRQMRSITLPCLVPTIVVLFLLRVGNVLDSNVEQVMVMLNPLVSDVGEVIDTYVYRVGLLGAQFSYTTAIAIFKSLVGLLLVVGLNGLSRRTTGESIY
ncbi:ABC transporter permease [Cohnella zeiphila]|uniref:Sugar ABC transporter permease n=1 Tax=Cohnella zeiphila TaxID=2761120 RepID=A0A7X0SQB9_9BACL|nr:ABC transporter permease subunit [Cohnella zeiphila]MBB6734119.1 sugar ABC transporter permease [Cohnella zeiphila]